MVKTIELSGTKKGLISITKISQPYGPGSNDVASICISLAGNTDNHEWKVHIPMENLDDVIKALQELNDLMITNKDLVDHLINTNSLYSEQIIEAFRNVDRADFIPSYTEEAYYDYPLPIGELQTISQPTTVAMMFEMLSPKKGETILDIGSGSGWTTALLSFIVKDEGSVTGLERIDKLVELGQKNLQKYNFKNSEILKASDKLGIEGKSLTKILVSAAAEKIPYELTKQLKTGGKLVIPVRSSIYEITKEENDKLKTKEHYGFVFVPLIYKDGN